MIFSFKCTLTEEFCILDNDDIDTIDSIEHKVSKTDYIM